MFFTGKGGPEALQVHLNNTYIRINSSKRVNPDGFVGIANSLTFIDQVAKAQDMKLVDAYPAAPAFILNAVAETLGKKPEDLTENDLLKVAELSIPLGGENVEGDGYDLSIIGKMTNLTSLSIYVSYKDPSFLNDLHKLKSLSIQNPSSERLPDFTALPELEILELTEGNIADLSFLKDLSHLKALNLQNNRIEELKDIANLTKLETLNVRGNRLVNI